MQNTYNFVVNLTDDFDPLDVKGTAREIEIVKSIFPGGEIFLKVKSVFQKTLVTSRCQDANDFVRMLQAGDAIRRLSGIIPDLFIPYFPAARQDRVCNHGESLSVKVYADCFNNYFDKVIVFDPHSDVTGSVLQNAEIIPPAFYWNKVLREYDVNESVVVIPDSGATKKVHLHSRSFQMPDGKYFQLVQGEKTRDVTTNKLTGFKVYGDVMDKTCIILDDICDGGGTFNGLGEVLIQQGARSLVLVVSHGIFSRGIEAMKIFSDIHMTDSFIIHHNLFVPKDVKTVVKIHNFKDML